MASWTNNGVGIQSKHQLGFANFNKNAFNSSNSTSGFGSNSDIFPKVNDFTAQKTLNYGFVPKDKPQTFNFGVGSNLSNPLSFDSNPIGQSPFPTNPTPPATTLVSSGGFSFGKNYTLHNGFTTPVSSGNSPSGGFSFGTYSTPEDKGFTTSPVSSGNSPSRVYSFGTNSTTTSVSSGNLPSGGFLFGTNSTLLPKENGFTIPAGNAQPGGFSFRTNSTLFPKENGFTTQKTPFVSNPFEQFQFGTKSKVTTPPSSVTGMETSSTDDHGGSRVKPYAKTPEIDGKLLSISAMPFYNTKSHEELRLEDYQLSGKTGMVLPCKTDKIHEEWRFENYMLTKKDEAETESSFSFPILNTSTSEFPSITPNSLRKFDIFNINPRPSTSNTSTTTNEPTPLVPFYQPVISTALSIGTVTQTTTSVPNPGNAFPSIPQPVSTGGFIPTSANLSENSQQQQPTSPCAVSVGQSIVTNPFATEVRHIPPTTTTLQYGISCLPVSYIAAKPAKEMPLVNARQLSLGRRRSPIVKYKPNTEEKKVPFYDEFPGIYKNSAALIPRENPGAWLVLPNKQNMLEKSLSKLSVSDQSTDICETGGTQSESLQADVIAMIPKFTSPEYFMKPSTDDLIENELKTPGFCCQVKNFVIGRHKYGSIKFLGETDVMNLDLESIVQFKNREVIVYMDEKAKPPVGQGLNKAAEITLLNIRCFDKNTGNQYTDGAKVDKYKECLVKKTTEQGAEFLSFDLVKGEWRFKVEHF